MGLVAIYIILLKGIGNQNVIWFAIIIVTMVGVAGELRLGFVFGILYGFGIANGGICYMNFKLIWKI